MRSAALSLKLAVAVFAGIVGFSGAQFLRKVGEATTAVVEKSLVSELAGNVSAARLADLEAALLPMYAALPKGENGYLGHQAVRYALHRLLLERHGWFIVGLEPSDEALPPYLHGEWVPQYLQGLLEEHLDGRGINLHEVAALAAALEDLVHAEAAERVDHVYKLLQLPSSGFISGEKADALVETYMMMYLDGGNFSISRDSLEEMASYFRHQYTDWASVESWMSEILGRYKQRAGAAGLNRSAVVSIVNELGERFGAFNDGECRSLKTELVAMEGRRPGRVPLADFYRKGLYSHWNFNEKKGYLRALGALDESVPSQPSVIVPNYLGSRPNCLVASSLYAVCCRNECEDLMAYLERDIAAPVATPQRIRELFANLPANSVAAAPELSETLVQRLQEIAERHGGQVPLHGRLFSQWMHHAFPRECPYPHEGANPQTPDEWMKESDEEVRQLLGECEKDGSCGGSAAGTASEEAHGLPWTDSEKLLTPTPAPPRATAGTFLRAALVVAAVLTILTVGPGLFSASQLGSCSAELANLQKSASGAARKPWHLALLIFAVAVLLEAVGILDRVAFAFTLGGGLLVVLVSPLASGGPKPHRKKLEDCV